MLTARWKRSAGVALGGFGGRAEGSSPDGSPTGPFATSYATYRHALQRVGLSVPRSDECAFRDGRQPRAPNAENRGGGINAVSTPQTASSCWGACLSDFLSEIRRSGGGTRTPDPRIMIPVL